MTVAKSKQSSIFISYPHKIAYLHEKLKAYFQDPPYDDFLWDDQEIRGGEIWDEQIQNAMARSSAAILLLSEEFLQSKYIIEDELPFLLNRARDGKLILIPVLIQSCDLNESPLRDIECLPRGNRPILEDREGDRLLEEVAEDIKKTLKEKVPHLWELRQRAYIETFPNNSRFDEARNLYVPLKGTDHGKSETAIYVGNAQVMKGARDRYDGAAVRGDRSSLLISHVIRTHRVVVLRGDPGAGKSTACRAMALQLADQLNNELARTSLKLSTDKLAPRIGSRLDQSSQLSGPEDSTLDTQPQLPIVIKLVDFSKYRRQSTANDTTTPYETLTWLIWNALRNSGAIRYRVEPTQSHDWFDGVKRNTPMTLFLDGLNEVAASSNREAYDAIRMLIDELKDTPSRVVITTRRHGFEVMQLGGTIKVFDILPFSDAQIVDYLEKRLGENAQTIYQSLGVRVREQLNNPLLLSMLCQNLENNPNLIPQNRAEVFNENVRHLLHYELDRGDDNFGADEKRHALDFLAYQMQNRGLSLERSEVVEIFADILSDAKQPDALITELCGNGLLRYEHEHGTVAFVRQPLQEYFCASQLIRVRQGAKSPDRHEWDPSFKQALHDDRWQEPVAMIGGLLDDRELSTVISRSLGHPELCGLMLANARPESDTEKRFIDRAKRNLTGSVRWISVITQSILVASVLASVAALIVAIWFVNSGTPPPGESRMAFDDPELRNPSTHWILLWVWFFVALWIAVFLGGAAREKLVNCHDGLIRKLIRRWMEPWQLALHYVDRDGSRRVLEELSQRFSQSRWTDQMLKHQLDVGDVDLNFKGLIDGLENPQQTTRVKAFLSTHYDHQLAMAMAERMPSRSNDVQSTYADVYERWLARRPQGSGEFVRILSEHIEHQRGDKSFRARVCALLRKHGFDVPSGGSVLAPVEISWLLLVGIWRRLVDVAAAPLSFTIRAQQSREELGTVGRAATSMYIRMSDRLLFHPNIEQMEITADHLLKHDAVDHSERLINAALQWYPNNFWLNYAKGFCLSEREDDSAADFYATALQVKPDDHELRRELIRQLRNANRIDEALKQAEMLVEVADSSENWVLLVDILIQQEQIDDALFQVDLALEQHPTDVELMWSKATVLFESREDFSQASSIFRRAREFRPREFNLTNNVVVCLTRAGNIDEAVNEVRQWLTKYPDEPEQWESLAATLLDFGTFSAALPFANEAIGRFPDNLQLRILLGDIHARGKSYSDAITCYELAMKTTPTDAKLLSASADCAWQAQRPNDAIRFANRLVDAVPRQPEAWETLIGYLVDSKEIAEADRRLEEALRKFPQRPTLHFQRGVHLENTDDLDGAIGAYETSLRFSPQNAKTLDRLIDCLVFHERVEQAIAVAQKAVDDAPDNEANCERLAVVLLEQAPDDIDRRERSITAGLDRFPRNPLLMYLHGLLLERTNRWAEAVETYRNALTIAPDNLALLEQIVGCLKTSGQLSDAIQFAEKAKDADPDNPQRWEETARIWIDLKQPDKATSLLQDAVKRFPNGVQILELLGDLRFDDKQYEDAAKWYRRANKVTPDEEYFLRRIADSLRLSGQLEEAHEFAQKAVKVDDCGAASWQTLAQVLIDSQRDGEAADVINNALNSFPGDIELLYWQANLHHNGGRYEQAIQSYRAALDESPDNRVLLENLAASLFAAGQKGEAREVVTKLVEIVPDDDTLWEKLAQYSVDLDDVNAAIGIVDAALEKFPENVNLLYRRGQMLEKSKNYEEAFKAYQEALSTLPDNALLLRCVARCSWFTNEKDEALSFSRRAVEAESAELINWEKLAEYLIGTANSDEAMDVLNRGLLQFPNNVNLLYLLGRLYDSTQDYDQAANAYEKARATLPENTQILSQLCTSLRFAKRFNEAKSIAESAIELKPDSPTSWPLLYNIHADAKEFDQGVQVVQRALESIPDNADLLFAKGWFEQLLKDHKQAIESFRLALARRPDHPRVLQNLAQCLRDDGQLQAALEIAQRGVIVSPNNAKCWYALLDLLSQLGNLAELEKTLDKSEKQFSEDPEWIYRKGNLRYRQERYDDAAEFYRSAFELVPTSAELLRWLANSERLSGDLEQARIDAFRAVELEPKNELGWHWLLYTLIDADSLTEAEQVIVRAEEQQGDRNVVSLLRADLLYYGKHDYSAAAAVYEQIRDAFPEYFEMQYNFSDSLRIIGRLEDAEAIARNTIERDPNDSTGWRALAGALIHAKQWEATRQCFRDSLSKFPQDVGVHSWYAVFLYSQMRYAEAAKTNEELIEKSPEDLILRLNLAWSLRENGDLQDAWQVANKCTEMDPSASMVSEILSRLHLDYGRHDDAQATLGAAKDRFDDLAEWYQIQSEIHLSRGKLDDARRAFDDGWRELHSGNRTPSPLIADDWHYLRAEIALRRGNPNEAIQALENIESPLDRSWHEFLLWLASGTPAQNASHDPLLSRFEAFVSVRRDASMQAYIHLDLLHKVPENGISRRARQACYWLEAQVGHRTNVSGITPSRLEHQAKMLSIGELERLKSLTNGFIESNKSDDLRSQLVGESAS